MACRYARIDAYIAKSAEFAEDLPADQILVAHIWKAMKLNEEGVKTPTLARNDLDKETEVLTLLDKGMSNKLIARAMGVSDETVKWHIKNLFLKLAAGTRKHAVDRARLLGLLTQ